MIRRQMEQTRSNLAEKLDALEQHVTTKVQSAGSAVNATAEAIQDAVHSVGNVFDLERQYRHHPWWFVGGSMIMGYMGTDLLQTEAVRPSLVQPNEQTNGGRRNGEPTNHDSRHVLNSNTNGHTNEAVVAAPSFSQESAIAGHEQTQPNDHSMISELRRVAIGAVAGIAQDLVARSLPQVMDFFRHESHTKQGQEERRSDSTKPGNV